MGTATSTNRGPLGHNLCYPMLEGSAPARLKASLQYSLGVILSYSKPFPSDLVRSDQGDLATVACVKELDILGNK